MVTAKSLVEINREAIQILSREIGVVDTIRFVSQFTMGYGIYTEERRMLFEDLTLDDILAAIKQGRKPR